MTTSSWKDPLPVYLWSLPIGKYHPAGFGYSKNHNVHTGVDLYVPDNIPVVSVEAGTVIAILQFTGPGTPYPSLIPTEAIMIEGATGVVLYGEVEVKKDIQVGQVIEAGSRIANIKCAILNQPMLHLELYKHGTKKPRVWKQGAVQPKSLLDPTPHLISLKTCKKR